MAEWSFPGNGNGQIRGYSDAGIETFSGNELQSLARETCQNSLDARANEQNTVKVEFERSLIESINIPGYDVFRRIIDKCKSYWDLQKTDKAHKFLRTAKQMINDDKIFVLRISDYNTKGLSDPYGSSFDGWNSLTKIDGGSTKEGDSAGSFGVGKNAPFCNSYYRLVFYRTFNMKNERAAQGISRLLSFPNDISDPMDTMTVGIGYYGNPDRNMPIEQIDGLELINRRNKETGTDVFVYGFKGINWEEEMIVEILESFLMAIYRNKLKVIIQGTQICCNSLKGLIGRYAQSAKNAYCNYRVLSEPDKVEEFEKDFHGLGVLRLRILIDPMDKLNRKVLIVRKSGMKLFQMAGISRVISFTGILELEGIKLNEYFREMETMAHDKWETKRHSDPKQAKEYYDELKDWVRKTVMDLGENSSDEEVEVEGLSGVLQDNELVRENSEAEDKKENLNNHLGNINLMVRHSRSMTKGKLYRLGDDNILQSRKSTDVAGIISNKGNLPTMRTLKGTRKRKTKDKHFGTPDVQGQEIVHQKNGVGSPCNLKNIRIIRIENTIYRMVIEVPYDVKEGHIDVVTVGENGKSSKLFIDNANLFDGCANVVTKNGSIEFKKMVGSSKVIIEFTLSDSREYALEVNVYEHN